MSKPKVVILDDNELSLSLYAEEYPENWKKICNSLKTSNKSKGYEKAKNAMEQLKRYAP